MGNDCVAECLGENVRNRQRSASYPKRTTALQRQQMIPVGRDIDRVNVASSTPRAASQDIIVAAASTQNSPPLMQQTEDIIPKSTMKSKASVAPINIKYNDLHWSQVDTQPKPTILYNQTEASFEKRSLY